jgi:hypothetical protein
MLYDHNHESKTQCSDYHNGDIDLPRSGTQYQDVAVFPAAVAEAASSTSTSASVLEVLLGHILPNYRHHNGPADTVTVPARELTRVVSGLQPPQLGRAVRSPPYPSSSYAVSHRLPSSPCSSSARASSESCGVQRPRGRRRQGGPGGQAGLCGRAPGLQQDRLAAPPR